MRSFTRLALSTGAWAGLLAGCSAAQVPIGVPDASWMRPTSRVEAVLFSFDGTDGHQPTTLLNVNGTFYGTTVTGGAGTGSNCFYFSETGCGTVFSITPSGVEHVLYSFTGVPDGEFPIGGLVEVNGTLYGTTLYGGAYNQGTVFSITPSGQERVLLSFSGNRDGGGPAAPLLDVNGILYGTTSGGGGKHSYGTVFSITTAGVEHVLHRFHGDFRSGYAPDGYAPYGGLTDVNGTLYGTTELGGVNCSRSRPGIVISGNGTVFSITTTGQERSLYSFCGTPDGSQPNATLTNVNGTLYGTTGAGGSNKCTGGCGTVFSVTTSGQEQVLHRFTGSDGWDPNHSALLKVGAMFYGGTILGGTGCSLGCGVVYAVTTRGKVSVLYRFAGIPDGATPSALINVKGTLYGTTAIGGAYGSTYGDGTIFSLKP